MLNEFDQYTNNDGKYTKKNKRNSKEDSVKNLLKDATGSLANIESVRGMLCASIYFQDRYSVLPEIYDIFGDTYLLKFLEIFGGQTIHIPTYDVITRNIKCILAYRELLDNGAADSKKLTITQELAERYDLRLQDLKNGCYEIRKHLKNSNGLFNTMFREKYNDLNIDFNNLNIECIGLKKKTRKKTNNDGRKRKEN